MQNCSTVWGVLGWLQSRPDSGVRQVPAVHRGYITNSSAAGQAQG